MFSSVDSMLLTAMKEEKPLWQVILEDDMADRSVKSLVLQGKDGLLSEGHAGRRTGL